MWVNGGSVEQLSGWRMSGVDSDSLMTWRTSTLPYTPLHSSTLLSHPVHSSPLLALSSALPSPPLPSPFSPPRPSPLSPRATEQMLQAKLGSATRSVVRSVYQVTRYVWNLAATLQFVLLQVLKFLEACTLPRCCRRCLIVCCGGDGGHILHDQKLCLGELWRMVGCGG